MLEPSQSILSQVFVKSIFLDINEYWIHTTMDFNLLLLDFGSNYLVLVCTLS